MGVAKLPLAILVSWGWVVVVKVLKAATGLCSSCNQPLLSDKDLSDGSMFSDLLTLADYWPG